MLKTKIDAASFASLDDTLKGEYKLQADGTYTLDLGDVFVTDKDPDKLFSALEKEREENKRVKEIADRLEAEKKAAEVAGLTGVEELKAHFENELKKIEADRLKEKQEAEEFQKKQKENAAKVLLQNQALSVASDLFGKNAALMLPHVQSMMKTNVEGDVPKVEIIDPATGLPSLDQNLDNFKKSLSTNELFKPMIVVANSSGGSANDGKRSTATTNEDGSQKTWQDYKSGELMTLKREQPDEYKKLLDSR